MKTLGLALCALLLASAANAQNLVASPEKGFSPSTQEEVLDTSSKRAHIEVWFSGGHKERFVFEEGARSVVEENGLALRRVGLAEMEMGAKKLHVAVTREDLRPDAFHVRTLRVMDTTMATGTTNTMVVLAPGESKTSLVPGEGTTEMTIKRLR